MARDRILIPVTGGQAGFQGFSGHPGQGVAYRLYPLHSLRSHSDLDDTQPDTMKTEMHLTNQFLIAMPNMADPNFEHSVTLVCEHDERGAMGVVINRPLKLHFSELLEHLEIETGTLFVDHPVLSGGPVRPEVGLVLHRPQGRWSSSLPIGTDLCLTSSKDILAAIGQGSGPEHAALVLGYAGWGPGQLEAELAANAWLTAPALTTIIFEATADECWQAAIRSLGIDPGHLSIDSGRA